MKIDNRVHLGRVCLTLLCSVGLSVALGCNANKSTDTIELAGNMGSPSPIDSVSTRGLEVRLMVVDDTQWSAARALLPFVQSDANAEARIDDSGFEQWADWGFRFVRVPIGEIQTVLDSLRPVQPSSNQWLGEFGQWRAIVRAGELRTSHVRVGEGSRSIVHGRPRLIARSWVEPMFTQSDVIPAVRVDLAMQMETKKRADASGVFQAQRERMIEDEGPVLDELIFTTMLDGSHALVLVGEVPGLEWDALPEPVESVDASEFNEDEPSAFGPSEEGAREVVDSQKPNESVKQANNTRSNIGQGPQRPVGKSLGELMLTSGGSRVEQLNKARVIPKRVVVALIPRAAGGYGLIPRVAKTGEDSR